ncbi:MAG: 3-phosphoserine/phosphohydroxythreonine transaminase [Desulfobacterales bacterium]
MSATRIRNFNAGPAALPLPVLQEIQETFLDFKGSGMSITEISHRSPWFDEVVADAVSRTRRLLQLSDQYQVLFLQGGASLQFCMVPMNFLGAGESADYVNTGTWSTKALKEARILGKTVSEVASSADRDFAYIPKEIQFNPQATYVHLSSNNTIKGTQWHAWPRTGGVPLVADMSSDILSRVLDPAPFGLIYAGAQKNIGPAGVCLVIIRDDMLSRVPEGLPSMLDYRLLSSKNSMYNTPPCFSVYTVQLVLKWLDETVGGVAAMEAINRRKAALIYDLLDRGDFYRGTADNDSRSLMNVTFRLPNEELEQRFIAQALENGLGGLKGHRSVGGCRASIYNATDEAAVSELCDFMVSFERQNG